MASSPDTGIAYSANFAHPAIATGDSEIFSNVESIPTVDFFGNKLNVNSTPNIGACNAKNGEIAN